MGSARDATAGGAGRSFMRTSADTARCLSNQRKTGQPSFRPAQRLSIGRLDRLFHWPASRPAGFTSGEPFRRRRLRTAGGGAAATDWVCFGSMSATRITLAPYRVAAMSSELSSDRLEASASPTS